MSEAYGLLIEPFASFGFMRTALVACVALALANGPIGTLLLLRRMSLEGDVLSHAVMPGAALGFLYAGYSFAALRRDLLRGFTRNARRQASPRSISCRWRWA
jgi:ABC-type Mn2+/Zn2+ transport system permease subunit